MISVQDRFNILGDAWEDETAPMSSVHAMKDNGLFPVLVGFGLKAIPWALERIKTSHQWCIVLAAITHEVPKVEHPGKAASIRDAWMGLAEKRGWPCE